MRPPIVVTLRLDERTLAAEEYERITERAGVLAERRAASEQARREAFENFGKPGRDAARLGGLFGELIERNGWKPHMQMAQLGGDWASIVGPALGAHTRVDSLRDGVLTIRADSPAWTTTLKGILPQVRQTIAVKLEGLRIDEVRVIGPQAHGPGMRKRMYVQSQIRGRGRR
ncbi:DciA family protein [Bifidobacterium cuniculi]|uniref:Zn-ribbon-containing, RNA-binding like protein n=1 Tax=Bifidobacterium cuniculi TaxID=1688 RepID=A0A087ANC7_9BIFI|nr:DUF721 domain-containing protein [Bifidobacterium cuniculi]KFI60277.1 Zn-ribbon-containing, RNA-binding like protein [Bifidobacterium cuniculi]